MRLTQAAGGVHVALADAAERRNGPSPAKFAPTPLTWEDPSTFPRRRFAYGRHYSRKYLGVTVAQTKVGKSSLVLVEALAMASGKPLLGVNPSRRMKIWYYSGRRLYGRERRGRVAGDGAANLLSGAPKNHGDDRR